MSRHTKNFSKGLFLLAIGSVTVLGCELLVDFDRTKIPVDQTEAGPIDATVPETSTTDTGAPDAATTDAADASDASDAADAADAPDGD